MRVYFTKPFDVQNNFSLQQKLTSKSMIKKIFSPEGIYYLNNNKLNKVVIIDGIVTKRTINNIDFLVDNSIITYEPVCYQLSPAHISETVWVKTYTLAEDLLLMVEMGEKGKASVNDDACVNGKASVNDMYFSTDAVNFEETIRTFLLELNLC